MLKSIYKSIISFICNDASSSKLLSLSLLYKIYFCYSSMKIIDVEIKKISDASVQPALIPGHRGPVPLFSLGPKVPRKRWLGTRSCPTSRNQLHLFASPEHRVMLGPRRVIEHAWQLGWVPVPTQQAKYPHTLILKVYQRLFNSRLHINLSFLHFTMLHE